MKCVKHTFKDLCFPKTECKEEGESSEGVQYYRNPGFKEISYPETSRTSVR